MFFPWSEKADELAHIESTYRTADRALTNPGFSKCYIDTYLSYLTNMNCTLKNRMETHAHKRNGISECQGRLGDRNYLAFPDPFLEE